MDGKLSNFAVLFIVTKKEGSHIAIFHLSIKIISRGKGKSAVAAAAYRAGAKIINEYDGVLHDYTRKGGVAHAEILLPNHTPVEYANRSILWNTVEKMEKAKNSQLAREIEIALPADLAKEQNLSLVREFVKKHFVAAGMCADFCIHDKNDGNPHAHIMLTMRPMNDDGTWGDKQRKEYALDAGGNKIYDPKKRTYKCKSIPATDWNEQTKAEEWRQGWAEMCNQVLEQNNHAERIDHRSYERQGIRQIPTIHLGTAAHQMEKRGIQTERGNINRNIRSFNQELCQLRARIGKLQKWIAKEARTDAATQKPTSIPSKNLISTLSILLDNPEAKSRSRKLIDLKSASAALAFLQSNNITTLPELNAKVNSMRGEVNDTREKLKPVERRLKTLDKHIEQADIYGKYGNKSRIESEEILFVAAKKYIADHLNGRGKIPLASWKAEYKMLDAEKGDLYQKYSRLKEAVRSAEIIKMAMERMVQGSSQKFSENKKEYEAGR